MQLARASADERVSGSLAQRRSDVGQPAILIDPGVPQLNLGRNLLSLERVWADGVTEQRLIFPPSQPVMAAVLLIGPTDRSSASKSRRSMTLPILTRSARRGAPLSFLALAVCWATADFAT